MGRENLKESVEAKRILYGGQERRDIGRERSQEVACANLGSRRCKAQRKAPKLLLSLADFLHGLGWAEAMEPKELLGVLGSRRVDLRRRRRSAPQRQWGNRINGKVPQDLVWRKKKKGLVVRPCSPRPSSPRLAFCNNVSRTRSLSKATNNPKGETCILGLRQDAANSDLDRVLATEHAHAVCILCESLIASPLTS